MPSDEQVCSALVNLLNTGWRVECYYNSDTDGSEACVLIANATASKLFRGVMHDEVIYSAYAWAKGLAIKQPPRAYYFGCHRKPGHFMWDVGLSRCVGAHQKPEGSPWSREDLDAGSFRPWVTSITQEGAQPQGKALMRHKDGWTVLSFWDRSVDSRYGAHSTFILEGTYDFAEAVSHAKMLFPRIWARFEFEVTEYNSNTRD